MFYCAYIFSHVWKRDLPRVRVYWDDRPNVSEAIHDDVTGHLCGEFTGHLCIPLTKASDTELFMSFFNVWMI